MTQRAKTNATSAVEWLLEHWQLLLAVVAIVWATMGKIRDSDLLQAKFDTLDKKQDAVITTLNEYMKQDAVWKAKAEERSKSLEKSIEEMKSEYRDMRDNKR